ncbi:hypothetical protein SDC9_197873 [bioreactor metagenome]|uniref:Uncharacterized protein n=1 Tax=bioreactor metagenome TaxID=1076179 RepID=A0A645IG27_9ZZZZ
MQLLFHFFIKQRQRGDLRDAVCKHGLQKAVDDLLQLGKSDNFVIKLGNPIRKGFHDGLHVQVFINTENVLDGDLHFAKDQDLLQPFHAVLVVIPILLQIRSDAPNQAYLLVVTQASGRDIKSVCQIGDLDQFHSQYSFNRLSCDCLQRLL